MKFYDNCRIAESSVIKLEDTSTKPLDIQNQDGKVSLQSHDCWA